VSGHTRCVRTDTHASTDKPSHICNLRRGPGVAIPWGMKHEIRLAAVLMAASFDAYAYQRRVVISVPNRTLVLFEGDQILKIYQVAVGKPSTPSPEGEFQIINRVPNPTWYGPDGPVAPGKDNPLGTRWMGLSFKGYGIHGTNAPGSIGKAASHGCIRMRQHDLEELFELVDVGDAVQLTQ
jgi:lipoprotein-anchoring transpeptidase ErfK/SrfK